MTTNVDGLRLVDGGDMTGHGVDRRCGVVVRRCRSVLVDDWAGRL